MLTTVKIETRAELAMLARVPIRAAANPVVAAAMRTADLFYREKARVRIGWEPALAGADCRVMQV